VVIAARAVGADAVGPTVLHPPPSALSTSDAELGEKVEVLA
jgi:hypothetical protein